MAASQSIRRAQVQRPKDPSTCPNHPGSDVIFVCLSEDCNEQLACIQCVSDTHHGHSLQEVTKCASGKRDSLRQILQQHVSNVDLTHAEEQIKITDKKVLDNEQKFQDREIVIKQRSKQIQDEVNAISEKMLQLCSNSKESNARKLEEHKNCLEKLVSTYKEQITSLETVCQDGTDLDVIFKENTFKLPTKMQFLNFPAMENLDKYNIPEVSDITSNLQNIMGLSSCTGDSSKCDTSFQVQAENESSIKYIRAVMDQVLVWFWNSRKVLLYNKYGVLTHTVKLQVQEHTNATQENSESDDADEYDYDSETEVGYQQLVEVDVEILDVFFASSDTSLWYCCNDNTVWQRNNDGTCSVRFSTEQKPKTLCMCMSGHVAVGTIDCNVVIYSQSGEKLYQSQNFLQWSPQKLIYSSKTERFAVLKSNANINILCQNLQDIYMFEKEKPFKGCDLKDICRAEGICFDSTGNLFIADKGNQIILMLDKDGNYIKTIPKESDDLYPIALSSVSDGYLWVAYRTPEIQYIIKMITY